ncbi:hypothetical protein CEXT_460441 [Caerostris extrusa]|uniref:Uncharacterized protein n=1 Tax=Caerostris extrusa TaxID=172846 RepID=A0AAV4QBD0_CAEEX|nr:hypothetical protein CEXT_460441 [Caerostris extrusa]
MKNSAKKIWHPSQTRRKQKNRMEGQSGSVSNNSSLKIGRSGQKWKNEIPFSTLRREKKIREAFGITETELQTQRYT